MVAAKKQSPRGKCKTAGCKNIAQARGLCQPCLREAYELIREKKYTEKELIDMGAILPVGRPGRKRIGRLSQQLAKAKR